MSKLGLQARLQLLGPLPKRPARLRRQARPPAPALHPVLVGQLLELSGLVQVRHIRVRKISNFKFQISNWSSFFGFPAVSRAFIRPTPLFTRQCVMIDLVPMQYVLVAYWYADWCLQSDVICDLYTCSGRRRSRGPGSSCRTTRTSSLRSSSTWVPPKTKKRLRHRPLGGFFARFRQHLPPVSCRMESSRCSTLRAVTVL